MSENLKPNGGMVHIREQINEDLVTGLTFQFEIKPSGEFAFRIYGDSLPLGNRDFAISKDGEVVGAGMFTGRCKPAWLTKLDEL